MKLQHKLTGLQIWGRPAPEPEELARTIREAELNHQRALARLLTLEHRAARPPTGKKARQARRDWNRERGELRDARQQVATRLDELRALHRLMQRIDPGGARWSGKGSVERIPRKPEVP